MDAATITTTADDNETNSAAIETLKQFADKLERSPLSHKECIEAAETIRRIVGAPPKGRDIIEARLEMVRAAAGEEQDPIPSRKAEVKEYSDADVLEAIRRGDIVAAERVFWAYLSSACRKAIEADNRRTQDVSGFLAGVSIGAVFARADIMPPFADFMMIATEAASDAGLALRHHGAANAWDIIEAERHEAPVRLA